MSVTPFEHPLLSGLLGDEEIAEQFSVAADITAMIGFEFALTTCEGREGVIPADAAAAILQALPGFVPDLAAIGEATARDGVVVPELVRQIREAVGAPHADYVHFGATSQDVIDTALVLRLREILDILGPRLSAMLELFRLLTQRFGDAAVMGRTRMQDALPIAFADRIGEWQEPVRRHIARLPAMRDRVLVLQLGGAVGTLDKLGDRGPAVARHMAAGLRLGLPERSWHSQRDAIAELANWLSLVTGTLGKMGQDIALMAQMGEIVLSGAGSSSAMAHKQNPVNAEMLVALARYNATLVGGMHQALIHEQERSGAAWTLEWLVLPQMAMATGAATRLAMKLLEQVEGIGGNG